MEHLARIQAVPCSYLRHLLGLLTFAGTVLRIVAHRTVRNAAIPQEQVTSVLALQTDAAGVPQVGHTLTAQRVAV